MAYQFTGPQALGIPGAIATSTLPNSNPAALTSTYTSLQNGMFLGQEVEGKDPVTGYWGKFKLLFGVANCAVGSVVFYNAASGLTILATGSKTGQPIAVSMAANTSSTTYSWFQTQGPATVLKTAVTVTPTVPIYISATAGRVKVLQSAYLQIIGAQSANTATVTSTTSTILVTLANPVAEGA